MSGYTDSFSTPFAEQPAPGAYADETHDETHDETPETKTASPAADSDQPAPQKRRGRGAAKITPSQARRVLDKHTQLADAEPRTVSLLAHALGVTDDPREVTIAALTAGRGSLAALAEARDLTEAEDPYEAMVIALSMERDTAKRVWAILGDFTDTDGALPNDPKKAARLIAQTAARLTSDDIVTLGSIGEMI